jgi:hypothetical protein
MLIFSEPSDLFRAYDVGVWFSIEVV